ncbi:hypothetical protein J3R30DRAFT_3702122 [Lentinula aciculospora]|uniref:MYND-type domain-containing protein n=1 Tax=Lentinula aciculospora TaxID=153920 RepID=A0A9W9ACQ9_9AGAR|nr:hypothetical protein J3R30DRAFT_3702122 [Lentinula aciculospora]
MSFAELKSTRRPKSYVVSSTSHPTISALGEQSVEPSLAHENDGAGFEQAISAKGMYSALPVYVEVRHSEVNGRGVWTKSPIKAGSVIFVTRPYASALSTPNLLSYCSSCFASSSNDSMSRCTKCRIAHYCDSTCQTNDWAIHKFECTSLENWDQAAPSSDIAPPSDAVRCLSRMLWKTRKRGFDTIQAREIANMQSHRLSLKPSAFETHTYLAHSLVQYMGLTSPADMAQYSLLSAADLVDTISRFVTNTFTVTDPTLIPLGAVVSPVVALINHSCDPNAVVVFPRVSTDQKTQEPLMQILTSYIDVTLPTHLRQQSLNETYHFNCLCHLCTTVDTVDLRAALNCPKNCDGLCHLPNDDSENILVRCAKCKSVVKSVGAALDARRVGKEGLEKASGLQMKDPEKSLQLTTNLIPILSSAGFTPSSYPLLGLTRLHQQLVTASFQSPLTQEHLDETIRIATKNATGITALYREGHPVLALALAELGKLLAVDEPSPRATDSPMIYPPSGLPRLKLAYENLLRARKMLLIGFGVANEGGQVGKEVREMLVALEKEIGVFKQGVRNVLQDTPKLKA